jgi:hypothetical protein
VAPLTLPSVASCHRCAANQHPLSLHLSSGLRVLLFVAVGLGVPGPGLMGPGQPDPRGVGQPSVVPGPPMNVYEELTPLVMQLSDPEKVRRRKDGFLHTYTSSSCDCV